MFYLHFWSLGLVFSIEEFRKSTTFNHVNTITEIYNSDCICNVYKQFRFKYKIIFEYSAHLQTTIFRENIYRKGYF